ncbi:MAG TPA: GGDEF domain-containing protein, partial [Catenuloplanes sp.]
MRGQPMEASARSRAGWWLWTAVALCASLVAVLIDLLVNAAPGAYTTTPQLGLAFALYQLLGVGLALRAWRHPDLDRRSRRAWGFMAIAYVLLSLSGTLRPFYPAGVGFPSPADLLRLAFAPVMLAGLLLLPLRTQGPRERHKVWLDAVLVVVASAMLLWYLGTTGPGVERAGRISGGALAAAIAYPALDLVLIFGASVVLFRGAAESARRPAALLGLAMLVIVAGDVYLGHRQSQFGATTPDRWQFACWVTGHFSLTMAAFAQCRLASRHRIEFDGSGARSISVLPYVAVVLSYLLLIFAVGGEYIRVLGLVAGTMIITGVVVVRQVIAVRQNHELAVTDPLTGLANRRELYDRLQLALTRSARNGQQVATLLIDINHLKQVNDTMGHDAGDQLLIAVGRILRRNVLGGDVAGRLGGDEFA